MHLVVTPVHKKKKTYRYARIVQSYRRPSDGMPAHKVIANLGNLPQLEIDNIRAALAASRSGKRVVLAPEIAERLEATPIRANLRYLPAAVALQLWREWRLPELLGELVSNVESEVPVQDIVAALTIHRCVAPDSKLHATRWFPTTALPELLGIKPGLFHNTRIHRTLEQLESCEVALQERLARRIHDRSDAFMALFMDATDTWFHGHGPQMAQKSRTKEGLYRRRVHILMLCNEHGFPLRWRVLPGKTQDAPAMKAMVEDISTCSWIGSAPLVCDRSMGQEGSIEVLAESGIRFLTALPRSEFDQYTDRIPHEALGHLTLGGTARSSKADHLIAGRTAEQAGMRKIADDLYVLDLGLIRKGELEEEAARGRALERALNTNADPAQSGLKLAETIAGERERGEVRSYREAGLRHGIHKSYASQLSRLLRLSPDIQQAIREGTAIGVPLRQLIELTRHRDMEQQRSMFDELLRKRSPRKRNTTRSPEDIVGEQDTTTSPTLRGVLYFNPEMFVRQRVRADNTLAYIHASVRELNSRLASPRSTRTQSSIYGEVSRLLKRDNLVDVFDVQLQQRKLNGRQRFEVVLTLQPLQWARRRRYDGFSILVGHPGLPHTADQLVELFRAKDAVEKDFETIKGPLKLRPVRHRTDAKVRAHVTLCMLALLIERTLERRLAEAGQPRTASATFERLSTCHLNQHDALDGLMPLYTITHCTTEQQALLETLEMAHLADDQEVAPAITPR